MDLTEEQREALTELLPWLIDGIMELTEAVQLIDEGRLTDTHRQKLHSLWNVAVTYKGLFPAEGE